MTAPSAQSPDLKGLLPSPAEVGSALHVWLAARKDSSLPNFAVGLPALLLLLATYIMGFKTTWVLPSTPQRYEAFVPLGALALAYVRRQWLLSLLASPETRLSTRPGGPFIVCTGCILWIFAQCWQSQELDVLTIFLIATGAVYYIYGSRGLQALSTPLLFLLLMTPIPSSWYMRFSYILQYAALKASISLLHLLKIHFKSVGNAILFNGLRLDVNDTFGGAGTVLGLMALTLWMLNMMQASMSQRIKAFVSAVIVGIGLNVLRIIAVGMVTLKSPGTAIKIYNANPWLFILLLFGVTLAISFKLKIRSRWRIPDYELVRLRLMNESILINESAEKVNSQQQLQPQSVVETQFNSQKLSVIPLLSTTDELSTQLDEHALESISGTGSP